MSNYHVPVLKDESIDALNIKKDGIYVDVTFGGGGHSREILKRLSGNSKLIVFDQDQDSFINIPESDRMIFANSNFRYLKRFLRFYKIDKIDGLIGDLGVSSHHFDSPERGFSFRFEGDLDMRMNQNQETKASDILNTYSRDKLTNILRYYGELKNAFKISNVICSRRENQAFSTIEDFTQALNPFIPKHQEHKFLAKIFQALRIETNKELDALKMMLEQAVEMMASHARISIISYHSLEDRLVKTFFKTGNFEGLEEKDIYGNVKNNQLKIISRKPILASETEIDNNNRARSAKLRIAEKI